MRFTMTRKFRLWRCTAIVWSCLYFVQAGPVERSIRVVREVYPEIEPEKVEGNQAQVCIVGDVVYGADETVPADQSCLKCKCQPPGVHCETTRCEKKPGCRAIHKPNNCCPEYQCECEHEGKFYANGERLETTPGGECKVCYCRGGEVQCAKVSCYIRTDCEGRTVPGQCCPKYEHCPPIEPTLDKLALKPEPSETKPSTTETTTRHITYLTTNITLIENEIDETTTSNQHQDSTMDDSFEATTQQATEETSEVVHEEPPRITIHEIIPEVKEIPMAEVSKKEVPPKTVQGQLLVEEAVPTSDDNPQEPIIEDANDVGISDSDLESSEVSEVFQHPPPVLRVGDQLLFLKKGEFVSDNDASTPSPVFTIIGAEGLQRGDIDSVEHHEVVKEDIPSTKLQAEDLENAKEETADEVASNFENAKREATVVENDMGKVNPTTESGERTENSTIDVAVQLATIESEPVASITETSEKFVPSSTILSATKNNDDIIIEDEAKVVPLENPAYPPIPDIMSQQETDDNLENIEQAELELSQLKKITEDTDASLKILPEILLIRNNHTIPENVSNTDWLKIQDVESLVNENAALPDFILKQVAPSDEVTTEDAATVSESNEIDNKSVVPIDLSVDTLNSDELLSFGTIINGESVEQNHLKKLAEDEPLVFSQSYEKVRSTETLEDETGENTTPKNIRQISLGSNEDASIEMYQKDSAESPNENKSDVEMIDPQLFEINVTSHVIKRNVTHEDEAKKTPDAPETRTIDPDSEKIFQELDDEIQLFSKANGNSTMGEEAKKEAEVIFKELLDEVNSPSTETPKLNNSNNKGGQARDRESAVLQRVSDAIAKFQLKDARQSLDKSILGILRDFFSTQYRSYKEN